MKNENSSQFIIYQSEDGQARFDVRFVGETVWLTQALMAELFGTTKQNIGQHLKNISLEQELSEESVVKDFFTTAEDFSVVRQEGSRQVNRTLKHYNLDAIISVGYRVQSYSSNLINQQNQRKAIKKHDATRTQ